MLTCAKQCRDKDDDLPLPIEELCSSWAGPGSGSQAQAGWQGLLAASPLISSWPEGSAALETKGGLCLLRACIPALSLKGSPVQPLPLQGLGGDSCASSQLGFPWSTLVGSKNRDFRRHQPQAPPEVQHSGWTAKLCLSSVYPCVATSCPHLGPRTISPTPTPLGPSMSYNLSPILLPY